VARFASFILIADTAVTERPTAEQIIEWVNRYPQYAADAFAVPSIGLILHLS